MLNARLKTYTAFTDKDVTYTAIGAVRTVYKKIRPDQTARPENASKTKNYLPGTLKRGLFCLVNEDISNASASLLELLTVLISGTALTEDEADFVDGP